MDRCSSCNRRDRPCPTAVFAFFQELVEWLDDNNFVKALFAGHTQLIRRSGDVLGFLCRERALSAQHLDIIWAAGGGGQDKDRRICVHEVPCVDRVDLAFGVDLFSSLAFKRESDRIGSGPRKRFFGF